MTSKLLALWEQPLTGTIIICILQILGLHQVTKIRGLERILFQLPKNYARHLKLHSMSLEVRVHNVSARRLYESLGFRNQHIKPRYYLDNHEDAVDMQANLLR